MAETISRRKLSGYVADRIAAGDALPQVMRELAAYLIETGRQREARLLVRDIETALLSHGTAVATVTSARALSDNAKQALEELVKAQYDGVSRVVMTENIDASLIGGVRLELPDKQLDASVKTRLEKLVV